jgi:hypothetical protein
VQAVNAAQASLPVPGVMPANLAAAYGFPGLVPGMIPGIPGLMPNLGTIPNYEAVKRAQELASRWGFQQGPMPILQMVTPPTAEELAAAAQARSVKAPVLRLDAQGREIDEQGNVVDRPKIASISTLKVSTISDLTDILSSAS